ncbi:ribonuclease H-like domain-containing protein, partial [Tanacetum coccineum]
DNGFHPNGTEAFITKVGNLVLTDFLTLYDVLVVPEYCVTLVSVHKVARDNKFIVAFDESKCFVMSQDLMGVIVMGIGKQVGGLFLAELVHLDLWWPYKVAISVMKGKYPYHLVFNMKPSLKHLRVFGCLCFATVLNNHDKFGSKAEKYVLIKSSFEVNKSSQDLDHVNFFDEVVYKGLDTPYDDTNLNAQPQNEGRNFSNPGNPTIDVGIGDEFYIFDVIIGSNGSASENEMAATSENDFAMSEPSAIPLEHNLSISIEPTVSDHVIDTITEYQTLLSKLIYLSYTRPDVAYSVHCLSQFMHKPLKSHLKIALKAISYLKGSPGKCIHKIKCTNTSLEVFVDADWAKCVITRKVIASATSETVWILKILKDLNWDHFIPAKVFCDSQAASKIAANSVFHERTKYLEINLHL